MRQFMSIRFDHDALNRWTDDPYVEPGERRERHKAKERILNVAKNRLSSLDLQGLRLSTLPDVFDDISFARVMNVNLRGNNITSLPKTMRILSGLQKLDISDCPHFQQFSGGTENWKKMSYIFFENCPNLSPRFLVQLSEVPSPGCELRYEKENMERLLIPEQQPALPPPLSMGLIRQTNDIGFEQITLREFMQSDRIIRSIDEIRRTA